MVVESVYTADLKSAAIMACGFESRSRYHEGGNKVRQHHGIKVGDLVKYKHHMFGEHGAIHLVTKAWCAAGADYAPSHYIILHDGDGIQHAASNFIVISRGI